MENPKQVTWGITGSIAAYLAPQIGAKLFRSGFTTEIILTEGAKKFVTATSLAVMSRSNFPIRSEKEALDDWRPLHIAIADRTDAMLVAPASAKTIAKLALGISDGLLSETFLALDESRPVIIVPAMNTRMSENRSVSRNLDYLRQYPNVKILDYKVGILACGHVGSGKMADVDDIVSVIRNTLALS